MPMLFCLLVAWYLVYRVGGRLTAKLARWSAKAADKVADTAGLLGRHGDRLREQATAAAQRLRGQASAATGPRTRAGQRHEEAIRCDRGPTTAPSAPAGSSTAGGGAADATGTAGSILGGLLGALLSWVRLAWVDAVAAAESAQARRGKQDQPAWWQWPSGDDPQAPVPPVQATAERTDGDPSGPAQPTPATALPIATAASPPSVSAVPTAASWPGWRPITPPAPLVGGSPSDGVVIWVPTDPAAPAATSAPVVRMTAHRTDWPAGQPQPLELPAAYPRLAITDGRDKTMETAAESGLGEYLTYTEAMSGTCQQGVTSVETTLAALENQDWSSTPVDSMREAMDLLGQARDKFTDAHEAFRASLAVRDAYTSNAHTGTKDSVLAD